MYPNSSSGGVVLSATGEPTASFSVHQMITELESIVPPPVHGSHWLGQARLAVRAADADQRRYRALSARLRYSFSINSVNTTTVVLLRPWQVAPAPSDTDTDTDRVPSHTLGRGKRDDQHWRSPSRTFLYLYLYLYLPSGQKNRELPGSLEEEAGMRPPPSPSPPLLPTEPLPFLVTNVSTSR